MKNITRPKLKWLFALCVLPAFPAHAAEPVYVGFAVLDGDRRNPEFSQSEQAEFWRGEGGFEPVLFDSRPLGLQDADVQQIYQNLRKFHAVLLVTPREGWRKFDETARVRAQKVAEGLARYVERGGGLLLMNQAVRYPGDEDEWFWNEVMKPFGVEILREGVADPSTTKSAVVKPGMKADFFYAENRLDHPLTRGLAGFWLPERAINGVPGVLLNEYSKEWTPVIRGGDAAKSWLRDENNNELLLSREGRVKSAPVIAAARNFGAGRIVSFPMFYAHNGQNASVAVWGDVAESKGVDGVPSDTLKFIFNAVHYVAEPALKEKSIGVYRPASYKPVTFPERHDLDKASAGNNGGTAGAGVVGAHSAYSDGTGTVEEFVRAAKAAGLNFIVFTDPLESLTEEKLEALKVDCARFSDDSFKAYPGVEFTDGSEIRWIVFGSKVVWPPAAIRVGNREYAQWDGKRIRHFGAYAHLCGFASNAIIDHGDLARAGAHPDNLWWQFKSVVRAYDGDRLAADNLRDYLFQQRDLRMVTPVAFTRIRNPEQVAKTAAAARTRVNNLKNFASAFDSSTSSYGAALAANQQVAFGGDIRIDQWNGALGSGPQSVRGVQRAKMKFKVSSPNGIAWAAVHDADLGIIRRFDGRGEKELAREFEIVRDRQRYLVLVAEDLDGNMAVSTPFWLYEYKQGLFRCGDNLNILGPLGIIWHPDRQEMPPWTKDMGNAEFFSVQGWDRGGADCPKQISHMYRHFVNLKGVGQYPVSPKREYMQGVRMNVKMASNNVQVVEMIQDELTETWGNDQRFAPAMGSIPRRVKDNEYFTRVHTLYSPRDRQEWYITWDHRRLRESLKDYDGSLQYMEGAVTFKKDVTLAGNVAIPLATSFVHPLGLGLDSAFIAKDAEKGVLTKEGTVESPFRMTGGLPLGGYAAQVNSPIGYVALIPTEGDDWRYDASLPDADGSTGIIFGLGKEGQTVKAGTTLKYAFIGAAVINPRPNHDRLEFLSRALNAAGGTDGYPNAVTAGTLENATFFYTVRAEANEAVFELGPKPGIGIDLPVRVLGLEDNGCAAVFSALRPFYRYFGLDTDGTAYFQEPIDEKNALWAGNVFVADDKELKLTLVVDGQSPGKPPFLQVHNPTKAAVKAKIWSPPHAPLFGGQSFEADIPAGDGVNLALTPN